MRDLPIFLQKICSQANCLCNQMFETLHYYRNNNYFFHSWVIHSLLQKWRHNKYDKFYVQSYICTAHFFLNCSDDLKIANSRPSASNFQKFFLVTETVFSHSWSEQFSIHKELNLVGSNSKGGIISGFFSLWIKSKKSAKSHSWASFL